MQIFLDLEQMSYSKGCGIQVSVRRSPRSPSGTKASLGALSEFRKPLYSQLQFNTAKNVDYNQQKEEAQELGSEGIRCGTSSCLLPAESCRQHLFLPAIMCGNTQLSREDSADGWSHRQSKPESLDPQAGAVWPKTPTISHISSTEYLTQPRTLW